MTRTPHSMPTVSSLRRDGGIAARARQRGIVLLIALVAVFMLMLAGLATMRSVGTTTLLSGNLAFREATVQSADYGLEAARAWLMIQSNASPSTLFNNNAGGGGAGYVSYWDDSFDPRNPNTWNNAFTIPSAPPGFQIQYLIHRMCRNANDSYVDPTPSGGGPPQVCYMASIIGTQGDSNSSIAYGSFNLFGTATGTPYYRITTRVVGPRNAESYVQAMVY